MKCAAATLLGKEHRKMADLGSGRERKQQFVFGHVDFALLCII